MGNLPVGLNFSGQFLRAACVGGRGLFLSFIIVGISDFETRYPN